MLEGGNNLEIFPTVLANVLKLIGNLFPEMSDNCDIVK